MCEININMTFGLFNANITLQIRFIRLILSNERCRSNLFAKDLNRSAFWCFLPSQPPIIRNSLTAEQQNAISSSLQRWDAFVAAMFVLRIHHFAEAAPVQVVVKGLYRLLKSLSLYSTCKMCRAFKMFTFRRSTYHQLPCGELLCWLFSVRSNGSTLF